MANLPVNKDHFSGEYIGEVLRLDGKQAQADRNRREVEADERPHRGTQLCHRQLYHFQRQGRPRYLKQQGAEEIPVRLKKNLDAVQAFFSDSSSPEAKDALQKIESALWFVNKTGSGPAKENAGFAARRTQKADRPRYKKSLCRHGAASDRFDLSAARCPVRAYGRLERESKAQKIAVGSAA